MLKKFLIGTVVALALLVGVTASAAYDFGTTTLKVGSKGPAVVAVQTVVGATADGSFGPMTKAAVMAWQASNGLTADGLFGNMSKAKANGGAVVGSYPAGCTSAVGYSPTTGASCASSVSLPAGCMSTAGYSSTTGAKCDGGSTSTGPLVGGAGDITISSNSTDVEDQVVTGAVDTKILGFKVQADGSDVSLTSLKVSLRNFENTTSSYRLDHYVTDVSVWMGGTKIGSASASDFTKTGYVYSKSISLSGAVVRNGVANKQAFYVTVSAPTTIDTADYTTADWNVLVDNVRFQDATGVIMTDSGTAQVPSTITALNIASTGVTGGFTFTSLANSGDVKVVISKDSGSPIVKNVTVSTTSSNKDNLLLKFKVKATGSTASFDTLRVTTTLTTTGATDTWATAVSSLVLKDGSGTEISSIDGGSIVTGENTFTLYDTKTVADSTAGEIFSVYANLNKGVTANFTTGLAISASLANLTALVPEDSNGGIITDSGAATGSIQTFVYDVPTISLVSSPTLALYTAAHDTTPADYVATFVMNVTAPDSGAVYVPLDTFAYTTTGTSGILYTVTGGAVVRSANMQYTGTDNVSTITETQSYRVDASSSQQFTITVHLTGNNASGKVALTGLWYETTNTTPNNSPLISGLTTMYTPSVYLPSGL